MKAYLPLHPNCDGGNMGEIIEVIYENGVLKPLKLTGVGL
ncbi:MAG: antitoxin family protein [Thermococci archaeon]|nr:antitoxin family protein [Thermococci archaeon]